MTYAVDLSAPPRSVRVASGSGQSGFTVTVLRTVYAHGEPVRKDSFTSVYTPGNPTTVYGPGGHPPGPYVVVASTE
jgi:hypothetical protein